MNKHSLCFVTLLIIPCFFSCKKSKSTATPTVDTTVVYTNYTELTAGNYWIYQNYELDSVNGAAHALGTFDSAFVLKDTVIDSNTYAIYYDLLYNGTYSYSYLRDSLGYTVTPGGGIAFCSTDFTTIFRTVTELPNMGDPDTTTVTYQMGFKDSTITVDAGTFVTSSYRQIYHFPAGYQYGSTREYDHRYAPGIGLVSYTTAFYFATPNMYERRLERYHVQ